MTLIAHAKCNSKVNKLRDEGIPSPMILHKLQIVEFTPANL